MQTPKIYIPFFFTLISGISAQHLRTSSATKVSNKCFIKSSDQDLYMHVWGGNTDGNNVMMHGDEDYAKRTRCNGPCPNSMFIFEKDLSQPDDVWYIRASDQNLYMHVYGGNQDGNNVVMHGDESYAKTTRCNGPCPNSMFVLEREPSRPNAWYIRASDQDLYMHVWGGNQDGNNVVMHGDENYAKRTRCNGPCPNSLFVLECDILEIDN